MIEDRYLKQVHLLLSIIPAIAKEKCFAMHGGTAINLFIRDMPRLSVDIDLTYLPIENRRDSLINISEALKRIRNNLCKNIKGIDVTQINQANELKLFCNLNRTTVKVEVNSIIRGTISEPIVMKLNDYAQSFFNQYCEIAIVPVGQLYGGKICAALDRQHPRDLFDIKYLFNNIKSIEIYKKGFIFCLLSSDRPIHEILNPNLINQELALNNQFKGMSKIDFSYNDFEETRQKIIKIINKILSDNDKQFLLQFKQGIITLDHSEFSDFYKYPSVKWKFENIMSLKNNNPQKHKKEFQKLQKVLYDT